MGMFTFSPCPHDSACPLPFPCAHKITHLNGVQDSSPNHVKFHEYSYAVFRVGASRQKLVYDTYRSETIERLKAGGKQYAQLLGNSKRLRGLLPWPRILSVTVKENSQNDMESELRDVSICMPDGEWIDYDVMYRNRKHKLKRGLRRKGKSVQMVGDGAFNLIRH